MPHKLAQVLIEGLEPDVGAPLVNALGVLDWMGDRYTVLVRPHLSAEDLLAAFVDSHTVGQIRKLAGPCLTATDRLCQQAKRLALKPRVVVRVLGNQPGVVRALVSDDRPALRSYPAPAVEEKRGNSAARGSQLPGERSSGLRPVSRVLLQRAQNDDAPRLRQVGPTQGAADWWLIPTVSSLGRASQTTHLQ